MAESSGRRDLVESTAAPLSGMAKFRLYLVCSVVFIDFVGLSLPLNIIPVLVDVKSPHHLIGCESLGLGKAYSITAFAHAVGMSISPPLMGRMSDRLGRRPLLLASMFGIAVAYTCQGLTRDYWWFVFYRFLTGLAGGGRPVAMAYAMDTVRDPKRRTSILGFINMISGLCFGVGPAIGGLFSSFGLSAPFFVAAAAATVTFALLYIYLPETHHKCRAYEVATRSPGVTLREPLLHEPSPARVDWVAFILLYSTSCIAVISTTVYFIIAPLVLRDVFNLDPLTASVTYLGDGVTVISGVYVLIYFCNTLEYTSAVVMTVAILINAISAGLFMLFLNSIGLYLLVKWVVFDTTMSIFFAGCPNIVADLAPKSRIGELMGYMTLSQGVGRLVATAAAGPLYDMDVYVPFTTTACGCLVASLLSWCMFCRAYWNVAVSHQEV
ncbi:hypothetical protein FOL46_009398 [Perkinsus olseni]|uniref:Major facilitator superfamily (MFS) profile domain-containing protein n=1 Tax=Perkinsus olseni TaxID=32597 RepID=A0A7J6L2D6_PEROL|nr:hypothetical protein FOL46_009398 [Perkinsus olseni]